jgi:hypothetical protein
MTALEMVAIDGKPPERPTRYSPFIYDDLADATAIPHSGAAR